MIRTCSLIGFLFLILTSCEQDDMLPQGPSEMEFRGVSLTDPNGIPLGPPDSTDWQLNDTWSTKEQSLFPASAAVVCLIGSGERIQPAYPNPAEGQVNLRLENIGEGLLHLRLVDEEYFSVGKWDSIPLQAGGQQNLAIDLSNIDLKDTVRLYYLIEKEICVFRGHGDIIIQ